MFDLHVLNPLDLRKALWPAIESSSRTGVPLLPPQVVKGVANQLCELAANRRLGLEEQALLQRLHNATSLQEYQDCAEALDKIQKHDVWKAETMSTEPEYNPASIEEHIQQLLCATAMSDLAAIQDYLRTDLSRDLGGMNMLSLYKHSWAGTKSLVEDYIAAVLDAINKFAEGAVGFKLATTEVKFYQQSLEDSLRYFGRSALTLSGGAIFGMKHVGVIKTLWEADVLPEIISGASAGSIVAAIVGVSNDEDMKETLEHFPESDLACFDPAGTSAVGWLRERALSLVRTGACFSMNNMERVMQDWLGDITFREAHWKTGRTLNICVSSADSDEPRLLNYVTAPDVLIWSAVCASCSVPTIFPTATIYEKDPIEKTTRLWMEHAKPLFVDGSLDHDIPMRKLSEMFNVNFFIVSQVNPHVRLFLGPEQQFTGQHRPANNPWWSPRTYYEKVKNVVRTEILHVAQQLTDIGFPEPYLRWASLFSQQYTGDINVLPTIHWEEYTHMMANPSQSFMLRAMRDGELAAWPKIYRIKNTVAIELALIRAIHLLRERVNFGPEARAARESTRAPRRGRTYSIKGERPAFLRRRSLSTEDHYATGFGLEVTPVSGPPTPGATSELRRHRSLGNFPSHFGLPLTSLQQPLLSPQSGLDQFLANGFLDDGSSLCMTAEDEDADRHD